MDAEARLKITIDAKKAQAEARRTGRAAKQMETGLSRAAKAADRLRRPLYDLRFLLVSLGAAGAAREIFRLNDAFTEQNSRLRLVSESERQVLSVRKDHLAISQQTRTGMASTVELYSRMSMAVQNLNLSEQKRLGLTKTITQAVMISGATAQEAAGAIRQLTQGLASGTIRGEEFNSISEQTPHVLTMVQNALGVTRGELRAMAFDGQLTTEVFLEAMDSQAAAAEKAAGSIKRTMSGAFIQLSNAFAEMIGSSEEFETATDVVIAGMDALRAVFEGTAEGVDLFVKAVGGALMVYLVTQIPAALTGVVTGFYALTSAVLKARAAMLTFVSNNVFTAVAALGLALGYSLGLLIKSHNDARKAAEEHHQSLVDLGRTAGGLNMDEATESIEKVSKALEEAEEKMERMLWPQPQPQDDPPRPRRKSGSWRAPWNSSRSE